jgi:flagellar biosynthesis/type III secretory pathway chaperone
MTQLETVLDELEAVLGRERVALTSLHVPTIESTSKEKLELYERLQKIEEAPSLELKSRLERIRSRTLENQVLLVHARETARGLAELVRGSLSATG